MPNIYVGSFKDLLKQYRKRQDVFLAEIAANDRKFSEEYAAEANRGVKLRMEQDYTRTRQSIGQVYKQVRDLLARSDYLDVESLTADRLFFESGAFDLTHDDIKGFVERYKHNPTMLKVIRNYCDKHKDPDAGIMGKYADIRIDLPKDQLHVYRTFANGALSLLDQMYMDGSSFNKSALNAYADEYFANNLYEVIGDGMNLSAFKSKNIPETAAHRFDDINLQSDVA